MAASTASLLPEITIWPGQLMFATSTTAWVAAAASRQTASTASSSMPRTAAIVPWPAGTASSISTPRRRTSRIASGKLRLPAETSAEYSPRLWPAT